jgi:6-pyruvoyltetrahydropterin/6-carboxytetrahydropterin synthase
MKGKLISTENLAMAIWDQLSDEVQARNARLYCVRLHETENNYVEYFGPNK